MTNRLRDLIRLIPRGPAYRATGTLLPTRGQQPTELLFTTGTASRRYDVYVNDVLVGSTTSDVNSQAIVRVVLEAGRRDITLIDTITQARLRAFTTVRPEITVMAAHADAFTTIDTNLDDIQNALALETAGPRLIEEVHGQRVAQSNDIGWVTDTYRRLLRWLRQAFRLAGAKLLGLRQVVAGYTSSLPLRWPRALRPTWILGQDLAPNGALGTKARVTASSLTNANARSDAWVHAAVAANLAGGPPTPFPGPFTDPPCTGAGGVITAPDGSGRQRLNSATRTYARDRVLGTRIRVRGATNSVNNGVFTIADFQAPSTFLYENAEGIAETFNGSFSLEALAERLQVTFSAGWDGGSVTLRGLLFDDIEIEETFTPTTVPSTVLGEVRFVTVSDGEKSVVGTAGTATVGLRDTRFLTVSSFGALNPPGARTLEYLASPDRLRWGGATAPTTAIPLSGAYSAREADRSAVWYSLVPDGGGFVIGADLTYLRLALDSKTEILANLTAATHSGGASPRTAAQVATSLNTYWKREPAYGAVKASSGFPIVCPAGAALVNGTLYLTLNDGVTPSDSAPAGLGFEFRDDLAAAAAGRVVVFYTAGDSAATVAASLAAAINHGANNGISAPPSTLAGLRMHAYSTGASVFLENDFGGVQGNQVITIIPPFAGPAAMTGGADAPNYLTPVTTSGGAPLGPVLKFVRSLGATPVGPSSKVHVAPWGADAARTVLGEPRFSSTLSAGVAARDVTLDLPASNRLPMPTLIPIELTTVTPMPVIIHAAFADTLSTVTSAFSQPAHPTVLEVYFDGAWRGGNIRLSGTARDGTLFSEEIEAPDQDVVSVLSLPLPGTAASVDGVTITLLVGTTLIEPGMFFRVTSGGFSGTGAYVRFVLSATSFVLHGAGIGGAFALQNWEVTRDVLVKGTQPFTTVLQAVNTSAVIVAGTAGTVTLSIIDGASYGYDVRVGRGIRISAAGNGTQFFQSVGSPGVFSLGTGSVWEEDDGWLQLRGMNVGGRTGVGDGTNNGLHRVIGKTAGLATGGMVQHEQADRFGRFDSEIVPGGGTWTVYSHGEIVRVVGKNATTGDLTLYPPGLRAARPSGALVEVASEMPFEVEGLLGPGEVEVTVDKNLLPTGATSDSLTLAGSEVPDGWRAFNTAATVDLPGHFAPKRLQLTASGVDTAGIGTTDQVFQVDLRRVDIEKYRGWTIRAAFWVQQHVDASETLRIDFSFDGVTFTTGSAVFGGPAHPATVAGTHNVGGGSGGVLDPTLILAQSAVPFDAQKCVVRLRHVGAAAAGVISVEKAIVMAPFATGLYLGQNTIPFGAHRSKFGEVLYVWSPEQLTETERTAIGLPSGVGSQGDEPGANQIDRVVNAHSVWDRYNVSEYSGSPPLPVNVKGCYDDSTVIGRGWGAATLYNMEMVIGTPPRGTVVRPAKISLVEAETLSFGPPSDATTAETSAHEGDLQGTLEVDAPGSITAGAAQVLTDPRANFPSTVVGQTITVEGSLFRVNNGSFPVTARTATTITYTNANGVAEPGFLGSYRVRTVFPEESFLEERLREDGLEVPATALVAGGVLPWRFTNATTVQVASVAAGDPAAEAVFNSAAVYTIDYRRLTRAETPPFDLGAGYADYLWLVDATVYRRAEPGSSSYERVQELDFSSGLQATLTRRSDADQSRATLVRDNGLIQETVPKGRWAFVNGGIVSIDGAVFDPESIYSLTYQALEPSYLRPASYVLEARSSNVSTGDVLTQRYRRVERDAPVPSERYHQLRVTISGVVTGRVQSGSGTGQVSGRVVTLSSGNFVPGAQRTGRVFRVRSGSSLGKTGHIVTGNASTLTLDADLGVLSALDWEVTVAQQNGDIEISSLGLRGLHVGGTGASLPGIIEP